MNTIKLPISVKVSYGSGAYNTATVLGQRSSSTSSAETAIASLVGKLHARLDLKPGSLAAKALPAKGLRAGVSMWSIDVAGGCGRG